MSTPKRLLTATRKIAAEETGLNAAFYLQVDRDPQGRVVGAQLKTPGKFDNSSIERVIAAINDALAGELEVAGAPAPGLSGPPSDIMPDPPQSNGEGATS